MCTIVGHDPAALRRAREEAARKATLRGMTPEERKARSARLAKQAEQERRARVEEEIADFVWEFCTKKRAAR
jgi:hypothetical protein